MAVRKRLMLNLILGSMAYTVSDISKILEFKTWTDLQKVDELLRIDASMYCNLGTDSSDSERSEVKKNSQSIYRAIKKIDPASGGIFMYDIDKV
jgi:hypothetical protein